MLPRKYEIQGDCQVETEVNLATARSFAATRAWIVAYAELHGIKISPSLNK